MPASLAVVIAALLFFAAAGFIAWVAVTLIMWIDDEHSTLVDVLKDEAEWFRDLSKRIY